jgi:3-isopropylmalate/(R)-2-methylmalate dehydratase small subunit
MMTMQRFSTITSRVVALSTENIDTDQIIPARFLKTTTKVGLGENLFADWRYTPDGEWVNDFPLNQPNSRGARVLLAGDNFGCGSSREHAPWALMDFGLRAVVSTSFADIFRQNALKNGLLPVVVDAETHRQLFSLADEDPEMEISIDLAEQALTLPDGRRVPFPIDAFSKECLMAGIDQLGYLLKQDQRISEFESTHRARVDTSLPAPKERRA